MQRIVWILVGIMLISFGLAALLGALLPGGGFSIISENIDSREAFNTAGLERMMVETVSTNVFVTPVDQEEITVHFHGWARGGADSIPELRVEKLADSLRVKIEHKPVIGFFNTLDVRLDIYVPRNYAGEMTVQTVSGDMDVKDLDLKIFRFKSVSGDLRAEAFSAAEGIFESISGNIRVTGLAGHARADTVSGDIVLRYKEFAHNITVKTTSGNTRLELPGEAEFAFSARTVSGKISTTFPTTLQGDNRNRTGVVGSGEHRITFSSVSGDVFIQPLGQE